MRLTVLAATIFGLCLAGCSSSANLKKPDQTKAVEVMKLAVRMPSKATQDDFESFQHKVEQAYAATTSKYSGAAEAGFVYSLSPAGAVNPFSAIEVSCISRETHAGKSAKQCEKFL
ncbi:MAG TPA: hypothetical protein PLL10_05175, partial [Elusimicrobiales bacterium]|nr:hypothetical protein [Elusimicrobiales bacterium]